MKGLKQSKRPKNVKLSEDDAKLIMSALVTDSLYLTERWKKEGGKPAEIAMGMVDHALMFESLCKVFGINADFGMWRKDRVEAQAKELT